MQNKFTKGILERQEREYKKQKAEKTFPEAEPLTAKVPPASNLEPEIVTTPAPVKKKETAVPSVSKAPPVQPSAPPIQEPPANFTPEAPKAIPQELPSTLEAYIVRDGGRKAKNKTFYLDGAVIQAVKRAAAVQRVTESKLVNDILKKVLNA